MATPNDAARGTGTADDGLPGKRVLLPVGLAAFITSLDTTVVTVAAPSIRRDLDLTLTDLEWVATSYVLAFAGLLLVGGRLTDLVGRRRILQTGMGVFTAASVVVAASPNAAVMLTGRTLQGAGAALVLPAVLAVVARDLAGKDRHLGAGVYTVCVAVSLALGPFVGGAISQFLHWSWIFWINIPIGLVSWALTRWALPASASRGAGGIAGPRDFVARLDVGGLLFSCASLTGVTFALVEGQKLGVTSPWVIGGVVLAVVAGAAVVAVERRVAYPLIDLRVIRHPMLLGGTGVQIIWGLGLNGVFFFTSLFLQDVLGFSPTMAGLAYLPLAVALIAVVPVSARLAATWGAHRTVATGMLVLAGGLGAVTFAGPGDDLVVLLPGLVLLGAGTALTTPMTSAMLEVVPPRRAGVVSALVSVSREVSGVLGIAFTGAVLTLRQGIELRAGASPDAAFLSGYRTGLLVGAALAVVGGYIALRTMGPGQPRIPDDEPDGERDGEPDSDPAVAHPGTSATARPTRTPDARTPDGLTPGSLRPDSLPDPQTADLPVLVGEARRDNRRAR